LLLFLRVVLGNVVRTGGFFVVRFVVDCVVNVVRWVVIFRP
jgi:hypothetical protein